MGADQNEVAANFANEHESEHSAIGKWQLVIGQTLLTAKAQSAAAKTSICREFNTSMGSYQKPRAKSQEPRAPEVKQ